MLTERHPCLTQADRYLRLLYFIVRLKFFTYHCTCRLMGPNNISFLCLRGPAMSDSDVISLIIPAVLRQILPAPAKYFPAVLVFNILIRVYQTKA